MAGFGKSKGVVIIGAGHAGGRTAERLRHGGFVGPIEVVGAERELPYERPPLSKNVLTARELPANSYLLPASRWNELGVNFHLGTVVTAINREQKTVELSNGSRLSYGSLVLATGLSPRRVAALEPVSSHVLSLCSFEDASALRSRMVPGMSMLLIGAGLIGLEVAASAAKRGAGVTVVEAAERPLGRFFPSYLSQWLGNVHRLAGIRILCRRQVAASSAAGSRALVTLDDGTRLETDLILVGIGGVPNDGLARAAGLEVGNGILVNEFGQTSDSDIFAVGDVALHLNPMFGTRWRLESWKNAEDLAGIVASYICGNPTPYNEVPWFWTDQHDLNIQIAGVPGGEAPALERGVIGERGYLAYFLMANRLKGAIGIACGRDVRIARETIKAGGHLNFQELHSRGFAAPAGAASKPERRAL